MYLIKICSGLKKSVWSFQMTKTIFNKYLYDFFSFNINFYYILLFLNTYIKYYN